MTVRIFTLEEKKESDYHFASFNDDVFYCWFERDNYSHEWFQEYLWVLGHQVSYDAAWKLQKKMCRVTFGKAQQGKPSPVPNMCAWKCHRRVFAVWSLFTPPPHYSN
jgi:hypothetical protein